MSSAHIKLHNIESRFSALHLLCSYHSSVSLKNITGRAEDRQIPILEQKSFENLQAEN